MSIRERLLVYIQEAWDNQEHTTWGAFKNEVVDKILSDPSILVKAENQELPTPPLKAGVEHWAWLAIN